MPIIDKKLPEFADVPHTLEGEVLLERTYDTNGKLTGFLTASKQEVLKRKGKAVAELAAEGWDKYKGVLDGLTMAKLQKP